MNELLVLSTADSPELAQKLALALVEAGAAACVNIIPGIRSIYRWRGKICDEGELLLMIKTTTDRFGSVCSTMRQLHSYQIPEVIALPITAGLPDYLAWLRAQVSETPPEKPDA